MTGDTVAKGMTAQTSNRVIIERRAAIGKDKISKIQTTAIKLNLSGTERADTVFIFHTVVQQLVFQM